MTEAEVSALEIIPVGNAILAEIVHVEQESKIITLDKDKDDLSGYKAHLIVISLGPEVKDIRPGDILITGFSTPYKKIDSTRVILSAEEVVAIRR